MFTQFFFRGILGGFSRPISMLDSNVCTAPKLKFCSFSELSRTIPQNVGELSEFLMNFVDILPTSVIVRRRFHGTLPEFRGSPDNCRRSAYPAEHCRQFQEHSRRRKIDGHLGNTGTGKLCTDIPLIYYSKYRYTRTKNTGRPKRRSWRNSGTCSSRRKPSRATKS